MDRDSIIRSFSPKMQALSTVVLCGNVHAGGQSASHFVPRSTSWLAREASHSEVRLIIRADTALFVVELLLLAAIDADAATSTASGRQ